MVGLAARSGAGRALMASLSLVVPAAALEDSDRAQALLLLVSAASLLLRKSCRGRRRVRPRRGIRREETAYKETACKGPQVEPPRLEVAIVGAGPTGLTPANILGQAGDRDPADRAQRRDGA